MRVLKIRAKRIRVYQTGFLHDKDLGKWDFSVAKAMAKMHGMNRNMNIGDEIILDKLRELMIRQIREDKQDEMTLSSLFTRLSQSMRTPKDIFIGRFGLSNRGDFHKICAIAGVPNFIKK
jgi:hypothetical protein